MPLDQQQFSDLIDTHARVIASAIRRVCSRRHRTLIPDIEQEVRMALWKRLRVGKEIEHPISYLHKVALTTALAVVRRHGAEADTPPEEGEEIRGRATAPLLGLLPAEQSRLLAEALGRLSADEQRAVRAHLAGFNHTDVAGLYGWTASIARHRIYRGLDKVRATMKGTLE